MKTLHQTVLMGAIAALLAACGNNSSTTTRAPSLAATMTSSKTSAQQGSHAASEYYEAIQKVYLAYFGRPADPAGLDWFANSLVGLNVATDIASINDLSASDQNVRALVDVFSNSQESQDLYAGDDDAFLEAVYHNLFNRPADSAGKAYWLDLLNRGVMSRARAALNILISARDSDAEIISRKTQVAANFTSALDLGAEKRGYSGNTANAAVRAMLGNVNDSTDVAGFQPTIDSTVAALAAAAPPSAEGLYHSLLPGSGNTDLDVLVLDDDRYYAFYGNQQASQFVMRGFIQGQASSNGTAFSSADMIDFGSTTPAGGSLSFNYQAGVSLGGTINTKSGPVPITGTPVASGTYNYAAGANLADIMGAWRLTERDADVADVTINADGHFTGTSNGCAFTGLITARPSKNVFDVTVSFGAAPCDLPNQTATGVGITFTMNAGATRQLILMGTNATRSAGAFWSGTRATSTGQVASLQQIDTAVGVGPAALNGDNVSVNYTGYIYSAAEPDLRAAQIDVSTHPITFQLGTGVVIAGWDAGLPGMQVGGRRTLIIPGSMAYGATGTGTVVPPDAALVFDVELVSLARS